MTTTDTATPAALSDLPADVLRKYAAELGIDTPPTLEPAELAELVRRRRELLAELDTAALLDVVVWARRPVRRSASVEELAREIALVSRQDYERLSPRGRRALARLRGLAPVDATDAVVLERLQQSENLWNRLKRKRREVVGAALAGLVEKAARGAEDSYQFLPEESAGKPESLREKIEVHGVVGGIASRLRGVADDYVRQKMDEIEARIDRKLEEIDRRLVEWRDREIATRLRIIRITLVASVLFALLSLGYHQLRRDAAEPGRAPAATSSPTDDAPPPAQTP